MNSRRSYRKIISAVVVLLIGIATSPAASQESIRVAYSSTDTLNSLWTIAAEAGFYKKHGLDAEVVYIGSTTVGISAIVAQDISIGNAAGSGVAGLSRTSTEPRALVSVIITGAL